MPNNEPLFEKTSCNTYLRPSLCYATRNESSARLSFATDFTVYRTRADSPEYNIIIYVLISSIEFSNTYTASVLYGADTGPSSTPYSFAFYYKYVTDSIIHVCVIYCVGIVRNRKERHLVCPISTFPVVTLLRARFRVPVQWHSVAFSGNIWEDKVDICSQIIILKVARQACCRNNVSFTWAVYIFNLSPLNQRHKSYKEDTDFNFILF